MKPVVLIVLDGWGLAPPSAGNPISQASLPTIGHIERFYPASSLQASGIAVGLPWGEAGNSEVGHLNMGAGKIVYQYLPRIILSIQDETFFKNPAFMQAINHTRKNNSSLHLMGLVSSGNVHSYIDHLYALMELIERERVEKIFLHIFTDGKDAPPFEAAKLIKNLAQRLENFPSIQIATIMGRSFAMDRNENWQNTQKSYQCLVQAGGENIEDAAQYLERSYQKEINDSYIRPAIIKKSKIQSPKPKTNPNDKNSNTKQLESRIKDGDAVVFFNFREDSARQLTKAFVDPNFNKFEREFIKDLCFVSMTQYSKDFAAKVAFPPPNIETGIGQILSQKGKKQLRIAETEKYAHITYFFNGLKERPLLNEEIIVIPSIGGISFDLYPQMRAQEIANQLLENLAKKKFDFFLVNFANADMVGHTGNFKAGIKALETIDGCLSKILKEVLDIDGTLIITSDHGNVEEMLNPVSGEALTEHTNNPVPFYLIDSKFRKEKTSRLELTGKEKPVGILADIAPTILELMNLSIPQNITGKSLLPKLISFP